MGSKAPLSTWDLSTACRGAFQMPTHYGTSNEKLGGSGNTRIMNNIKLLVC